MAAISARQGSVFDRLGVRPAINASGVYTDLGGASFSPAIWTALEEMNACFVDIPTLLDRTGAIIAELVGAEAARVTPGASAALALSAAACIAGMDGRKWETLPDTRGMRSTMLMQRNQRTRYMYTRCASLAGCTMVDVGDDRGTTADQLAAALQADVVAVLFPAHLEGQGTTLGLETVAMLAHSAGVAVVVDAAYMNFPPELMGTYARRGADLTCFSAKYFYGPNAGGFVSGRRDLVQSIAGLDFTRYESGQYRTFGRAFKMGRFEIAATALALQEWFETDHTVRWAQYARQVDALCAQLAGTRGLTCTPMCFTMDERFEPEPINCLAIALSSAAGLTARQLDARLTASTPSIRAVLHGDSLAVVMETVPEGQECLIGNRVLEALAEV